MSNDFWSIAAPILGYAVGSYFGYPQLGTVASSAVQQGVQAGTSGSPGAAGAIRAAAGGEQDVQREIDFGEVMGSAAKRGLGAGISGGIQSGIGKGFEALYGSFKRDKPTSAAELGARARQFNQAAFPGTNPWEQLGGPQAQTGPIALEREKRKTALGVSDKSVSATRDAARIAADASVKSSRMAARAQALQAAVALGHRDPDKVMNAVVDEGSIGPTGMSPQDRTSRAAMVNAVVNRALGRLKASEFRFKVGKELGNPVRAALSNLTYDIWNHGDKAPGTPGYSQIVQKHYKALQAAGLSKEAVDAIAPYIAGILGIGALKGARKAIPGLLKGRPPVQAIPNKAGQPRGAR